jgi:hypothetical protein
VALAVARVGGVTWSATERTAGDFYASMPGAHIETLNPILWNSPDLQASWGYHEPTYFHGPTQYLTLYPTAIFDSFSQIAALLLPLYLASLVLAAWLMWGVARRLGAGPVAFVPLLASTFLFFPLLQAYLQREFEVVLFLALAAALWCLVHDRKNAAAALFAYAAWFKYIPLLFAGYLAWRRWWRAVLVFAVVSVIVLIAAELLFGLSRFFNNNVPGHARQVFVLWGHGFGRDATGHLYGTGFCEGWLEHNSTLANIRHGLCAMAVTQPWVNPPAIYLAMCLTIAIIYLATHHRIDRAMLSGTDEARRRALEVSIVTTVCACFFFAHYYYLIALVIPFNVLLAIYIADRRDTALMWWAAAYLLVGAFVVPTGILNRIAGVNVWERYMWQSWFWYGETLLMGLLLVEYHRLAGTRPLNATPQRSVA